MARLRSTGGFGVLILYQEIGAGNRIRTGDLNLGKVALYQLSYSRKSSILMLWLTPSNHRVLLVTLSLPHHFEARIVSLNHLMSSR